MCYKKSIDFYNNNKIGKKEKKKEKHRTSLIDLVAKICAKKMKRILQGVNRIRIKVKDKNYQLSPHASRALVIMIRKKA